MFGVISALGVLVFSVLSAGCLVCGLAYIGYTFPNAKKEQAELYKFARIFLKLFVISVLLFLASLFGWVN